eukprot:tig00001409_g8630.t1
MKETSSPGLFYGALIAGILPAGALGYWWAGRHYHRRLCTGRAYGLSMERAWHVEVATRFLLEDQSPRALDMAEQIFQRGLQRFPYSAAVRISYGAFLLSFNENKHLGNFWFNEALKFDPFLDMHFRIFRADQDRLQETQSLSSAKHGGDSSESLIMHLEFQKNMSGAKRFHKHSVRAFRKFWSLLLSEDVTLARLEEAEQAHYQALIAQHPNNPRILRSYGKFHEEVLRDEAAAADLYDAADEFEETITAQQKGQSKLLDQEAMDSDGEDVDGASGWDAGAATARSGAGDASQPPTDAAGASSSG